MRLLFWDQVLCLIFDFAFTYAIWQIIKETFCNGEVKGTEVPTVSAKINEAGKNANDAESGASIMQLIWF